MVTKQPLAPLWAPMSLASSGAITGRRRCRGSPAGYLAHARKLDEHEALLRFDEVQVGTGRCGAMYGHQIDGVTLTPCN